MFFSLCCYIHIVYLLSLASTTRYKEDKPYLRSKVIVRSPGALSAETSDSSARHSLRHRFLHATALKAKRDVSGGVSDIDVSVREETTIRTTRRRHRKKRKNTKKTTSLTTKFEKGTTKTRYKISTKKHKSHNSKKHRKRHHKKKHTTRTSTETTKHIQKHKHTKDKRNLRSEDYVYTFVNNTVNENGEKLQKIFIYNRTHYIEYNGNVIPGNFVHLYKLWTQLNGAKEFDSEFSPPWWMQWHKPPWWMDWHKIPEQVSNDTWDIWNLPGMHPPAPKVSNANKFSDFANWLRHLWSQVKVENIRISSPDIPIRTAANVEWEIPNLSGLNNYVPFNLMGRLRQLWNRVRDNSVNTRSFDLSRNTSKIQANQSYLSTIKWQTNPHKVKHDKHINNFTKYIKNSTLKFFDNVRGRSQEYHWRKGIKRLSRIYEEKYEEFLKDMRNHKIKSQLGAQKVIINSIDMSNRIVSRLLNLMMSDMDKIGLLRYSHTADYFRKELKNEKKRQLAAACTDLQVCRAGNGLIQLILDILHTMLRVNDRKFKQAFDSLTEATKNTNFIPAFGKKGDDALKRAVRRFESQNTLMQRMVVMLLRNIIDKRNSHLDISPDIDPSSSRARMTLAFQEILNKIDEKVPNSVENIATWNGLQNDMEAWAREDSPDVQNIMERFMTHIKQCIENLDGESTKIINQNVNKIVS